MKDKKLEFRLLKSCRIYLEYLSQVLVGFVEKFDCIYNYLQVVESCSLLFEVFVKKLHCNLMTVMIVFVYIKNEY